MNLLFPTVTNSLASTNASFTFSVQVATFRNHLTNNTELSECMTFAERLENYVISYNSWKEQTYRDNRDMSLLYQQVRETIHFTSIRNHVFGVLQMAQVSMIFISMTLVVASKRLTFRVTCKELLTINLSSFIVRLNLIEFFSLC